MVPVVMAIILRCHLPLSEMFNVFSGTLVTETALKAALIPTKRPACPAFCSSIFRHRRYDLKYR
ncbi:AcrZ family multidrug efflux pump-associated protein [Enterobacter cloacae subsp. cloacae]|nr:AcrZ family multidrug efflux pump-associated protein [Enterobacter cloacae subsp. cloacae]